MAFKKVYEENQRREKEIQRNYANNSSNPCCANCLYYRKKTSTSGICEVLKVHRNGPLREVNADLRCNGYSPSSFSSPLLWWNYLYKF